MTVTAANGERVQSTHDGALDIPGLPPRARYAHIIPGIKHSLLSVVQLCNLGCKIVFVRWGLNVEVRYKGKVIMTGRKARSTDCGTYKSQRSARITLNRQMIVRITSINKAKRPLPKPPKVKSDVSQPTHRNSESLHIKIP